MDFYDLFLQFFLPFLLVVDATLVILGQSMHFTEHITTFTFNPIYPYFSLAAKTLLFVLLHSFRWDDFLLFFNLS